MKTVRAGLELGLYGGAGYITQEIALQTANSSQVSFLGALTVIVVKARVALRVSQVQPKGDVATQKGRFDKGETILFGFLGGGKVKAKGLAPAKKVAFGKGHDQSESVIRRKGATETQRPGGLFFDVDINANLIRS